MKPNIMLLVIDSLRSDQFQNTKKTSITPNIDYLIENGTYFSQAISSADGTILSLNTIINGLFPNSIGTRAQKIQLKEKNLVSTLIKNNYHFYGFLPNLTSFQSLIKLCENKNPTYDPGPPTVPLEKTGPQILDLLNSKNLKEPWFYFLHLFDLHAIREGSMPTGLENFNLEKFGSTKYEKIVSSIDYWLGKILEKIDLTNTIVIITADHGEKIPIDEKDSVSFEPPLTASKEIGKRLLPKSAQNIGGKSLSKLRKGIAAVRIANANRNLTHYEKRSRLPHFTLSLFDENIRIPLLIYGPKISKKIITQQVGAVDVFPTILSILELESNSKLDGTSLLPLLNGRVFPENIIYLHTMPHEKLSEDDCVGVRTSKYKYFRHARIPTQNVHLFDIINDTFENNNINDEFPDIVKNFENILSGFPESNFENSNNNNTEEDQKISNELKKLGYI
jgi:arylsulfatase A-like enzyme